jgi:hypothetical protein
MKKYLLLLNIFLFASSITVVAQPLASALQSPLLPGGQWWDGTAHRMPSNQSDSFSFNLYGDASNNQSAPLLLSSNGRWVCCDEPFQFSFQKDTLRAAAHPGNNIQSGTAGNNLRSAYQHAFRNFFPASGQWPDSLLATAPQYNLWIELQYNPNQKASWIMPKKFCKTGCPPACL